MCGISGAVVHCARAREIAFAISAQLERRGYDNAGMAVQDTNTGVFTVRKVVGATKELQPLVAGLPEGKVAMGHTRWATTGEVIRQNAHPFRVGKVVGAGNGDVTNHNALREQLRRSTKLTSDVDTEVAIAIIAEQFDNLEQELSAENRLLIAIQATVPKLEGSFALVLGTDGFEGLVVVRHGLNTAFIGKMPDNKGYALSSDKESLLEFTHEFHAVQDGDVAVITLDEVRFVKGSTFELRAVSVSEFETGAASKGVYPTFLEKEIWEQPQCLRRLVSSGMATCPDFNNIKNAVVLACGSALLAGKVGQYLLETAGLPTYVVVASEFTSWPQVGNKQTLIIAVSQSGTTADVLEAVGAAQELGFGALVAVTNTLSSPLAAMSDFVIPILSGPEISVASTKAVTSMAAVFALLAGCLEQGQKAKIRKTADLIEKMLHNEHLIAHYDSVARYLAGAISTPPIIVLGQGIGHVAAREIALKIKELTTLPTEAFASRELKHGPIAMIKVGTPVIFCAVGMREDTVVNQVKARGAFAIGIIEEGSPFFDSFDLVIVTPEAKTPLDQFVATLIPGQLIALKLATLLGKDVDRPANLAKSATTK